MARNYEGLTKFQNWVFMVAAQLIQMRYVPDLINTRSGKITTAGTAIFMPELMEQLEAALKELEKNGWIT